MAQGTNNKIQFQEDFFSSSTDIRFLMFTAFGTVINKRQRTRSSVLEQSINSIQADLQGKNVSIEYYNKNLNIG